jgi:carbon-monoxide dehydrogenase medium subunit
MLHAFSYDDPATLKEALTILAEHGTRTSVFAGGTDLFVGIRSGLHTPERVMNLKRIPELNQLSWSDDEGLSIGACVSVNRLLEEPMVREWFPVLYAAGNELATFQLRNRATVVGNVVTASPCGDMPGPLLVHGGQVVLASLAGERRVPLHEFITGVKRTIIRAEEMVARIVIPPTWAGANGGYEKLKRIKGHDLGVVSVALIKHPNAVRVAISSAAPTPVLLPDQPVDAAAAQVIAEAEQRISPIDDVRASAEYRAFMVRVFITRLMDRVPAVEEVPA